MGWGIVQNYPDKKILVNSYLTVGEHYGIRARIIYNMYNIWRAAAEMPPIRCRKKIEKNQNTPLRISAAYGRLLAFPRKKGTSIYDNCTTASSDNWRAYYPR